MTRARIDKDISLRVRCHSGYFAQMDIVRELEQTWVRVETYLWHGLRRGDHPRDKHRSQQAQQVALHDQPPLPYFAYEILVCCGFNISFCTLHDSISATMISFGFRQSNMCTT